MNKRENILSLYRRQGYERAPINFMLCPELVEVYKKKTGDLECKVDEYFDFDIREINALPCVTASDEEYKKYYDHDFKEGTIFDDYGVAHEPGSEEAKHFTRMYHPMEKMKDIEEMENYPFPQIDTSYGKQQEENVKKIRKKGYAVSGGYEATIWERAWYLRSMPELMCDMMVDDEKAVFIFDKLTEDAIIQCTSFAKAGVDIIRMGDDVGMQSTIMMSVDMYSKWIKPRLKKVIDEVKKVNPDVLIQYHSCGYITPFIDHLVDAGIDILNPVQPESMEFKEIYDKYKDKLSFNGTIGTQTTMPFGTPEEVYNKVHDNLNIVGPMGGLFCAPTHILEPEVPWENILAYVKACKDYNPKNQ